MTKTTTTFRGPDDFLIPVETLRDLSMELRDDADEYAITQQAIAGDLEAQKWCRDKIAELAFEGRLPEALAGLPNAEPPEGWQERLEAHARARGVLPAMPRTEPEITVDLESANGPKVTYPAGTDGEIVDMAIPEGWEVDWETAPADVVGGRKASPLKPTE